VGNRERKKMRKFVEKDVVMDNAILKSRLHDYIEQADHDLLLAIYVLLGKKDSSKNSYDEQTLKMLYKRMELDEQHLSQSYTKHETLTFIRSQKHKQ